MRYRVGRCRLRELRKKRGWTQEELARRTKSTKSLVSDYERGERRMMLSTAKSFAIALDCHIDDLYEWYAE